MGLENTDRSVQLGVYSGPGNYYGTPCTIASVFFNPIEVTS